MRANNLRWKIWRNSSLFFFFSLSFLCKLGSTWNAQVWTRCNCKRLWPFPETKMMFFKLMQVNIINWTSAIHRHCLPISTDVAFLDGFNSFAILIWHYSINWNCIEVFPVNDTTCCGLPCYHLSCWIQLLIWSCAMQLVFRVPSSNWLFFLVLADAIKECIQRSGVSGEDWKLSKNGSWGKT